MCLYALVFLRMKGKKIFWKGGWSQGIFRAHVLITLLSPPQTFLICFKPLTYIPTPLNSLSTPQLPLFTLP
jgi:hypothetical protein